RLARAQRLAGDDALLGQREAGPRVACQGLGVSGLIEHVRYLVRVAQGAGPGQGRVGVLPGQRRPERQRELTIEVAEHPLALDELEAGTQPLQGRAAGLQRVLGCGVLALLEQEDPELDPRGRHAPGVCERLVDRDGLAYVCALAV